MTPAATTDGAVEADDDFVPEDPQRRQSFPLRPLVQSPTAATLLEGDPLDGHPTPTETSPQIPSTRSRAQPTAESSSLSSEIPSTNTLLIFPPSASTWNHVVGSDTKTSSYVKRAAAPESRSKVPHRSAETTSTPLPYLNVSPEFNAASYGSLSPTNPSSSSRSRRPRARIAKPDSSVTSGSEPTLSALSVNSAEERGTAAAARDGVEAEAELGSQEEEETDHGADMAPPGSGMQRRSRKRSGEFEPLMAGVDPRFHLPEVAVSNEGLLGDPKLYGSVEDSHDDDGSSADGLDASDLPESLNGEPRPEDDSPYEVVRASVPPTDNTTLSINTPRMWFLSMLFSVLGSSTNLFFSLRYPSVAITATIALLLVHPLGYLWDGLFKRSDDPAEEFVDGVLVRRLLTSEGLPEPSLKRGLLERARLWMGQGRWNEKEHTCVYVSSNVSFGFAFATDVIVEQTQFYGQDLGIVYQLLLILSTQILGYAFAGLTRRFLVRPSGMIWPATLASTAMFSTLHRNENEPADGWTISRWRFFMNIWGSAAAFYFLPGLLMPALSYFNVITWFAPDNVVVANLFGVVSGLGLFPMTFDWAQVAYIGSPLLSPFWAAMNIISGLVIVMWILAPLAYYRDWFSSSYMPILSSAVFDNTGQVYDVSKILTKDFVFDREAYLKYSRVFLPITYILSYGVQFAGLASLLTHTACWHGREMWVQWKTSLAEAKEISKSTYQPVPSSEPQTPVSPEDTTSSQNFTRVSSNRDDLFTREDVHNRLMRRYKDAPMSWYLLTFVSMTAIGVFIVEYYPVRLPWYGLLMALGICTVLFIPAGIIMAVTNQQSSIYLICQLICGAVFPGRPVANMLFVTYGYISSTQGLKFAADLKLGHYMKIPPRIMFTVQMASTVVSSFTQIAVLNWMFRNVPGICTPDAINGFTCPIARVHFNGSILWGVVGPAEFFGPQALYRPLVWCFLAGAVAPVPLWWYARRRRGSVVRKINLPVLLGSLSWIPPATGLNFSVWAVVCYIFNYQIKRRASKWWAKYAMTLSAGLDSGLAFGIVVVFFGFIYPNVMGGFSWWGTEVYKQGCDWNACAYRTVPEGGHFGPDSW